MLNIYIKPIEQCNLRCKHCYNGYHKEILNFKKLCKYLSQLNNIDKFFIWHGGEPLLGNIKEMLATMQVFPGKWRITSNLTLPITREGFSLFHKASEVRTSFDLGIRFGRVIELARWCHNVKKLVKSGIDVMINICATNELLKKDPSKLLRMLDRLGVRRFYVDALTDAGNARLHHDIFPRYENMDDWLVRLHEAGKDFPNLINMRDFEIMAGIRSEFEFCRGEHCCHSTMTINSDGTVAGCVENSREKAFSNLDGDAMADMRHIMTKKCSGAHKTACLGCDYFKVCRSGCKNIPWQGNTCPYPKKLSDTLRRETS